MCDLLQHRIQALNYWQNTETLTPMCDHCGKEIRWGDGFIIDSIFLCDSCGETLHPPNGKKTI